MNEGLGFIVDQGIVVAENNIVLVGPLCKIRGVLHSGNDPVRLCARLLRCAPKLARWDALGRLVSRLVRVVCVCGRWWNRGLGAEQWLLSSRVATVVCASCSVGGLIQGSRALAVHDGAIVVFDSLVIGSAGIICIGFRLWGGLSIREKACLSYSVG